MGSMIVDRTRYRNRAWHTATQTIALIERSMIVSSAFARWAARIAFISGYWETFTLMTAICVIWALSGPIFAFSDTWQLVINTATTVLTFLMVFLIQNTQNRDSLAIHLKLDEIIRAIATAENELIAAEEESDEELAARMDQMREVARES
jgi:low affinity Fe/Cu permease